VVSRNPLWRFAGVATVDSLQKALSLAGADDEVFVIGGEQIFREALPVADRILLTEIDRDFEGDVFFPPLATQEWRQTASEELFDEASNLRYNNRTLERQK